MDTNPIKRRLAAILAADAVSYSAHMAEDEELTLRTLTGHRTIIDGLIATYDGRIVATAGDSVLAEFGSSVDAVRCAVEIQQALATRNNSLPEAERLLFRIGINLGDVIVSGDDILGDGVNVAARLESIADPGGICVSSSVYDQITGKLNLGFADMGQQSLKNIARPVRTYRLDRDSAGVHPKPPAKSSGRGPIVWGGAALAVVVVAAAAYFVGGAGPTSSVPPAKDASQVSADANDEARIKLQTAEAERARAEAELERARLGAVSPATRAVDDRVLIEFGVAGRGGPVTAGGRLAKDGTLTLQVVRVGRGGQRGARQGGAGAGAFSGRIVNGRGTLTGPQGRCKVALVMN